jgi:hypothetical protein
MLMRRALAHAPRKGRAIVYEIRPPLRRASRATSPPIDGGEETPIASATPFLSPFEGERWFAKQTGVGVWHIISKCPAAKGRAAVSAYFCSSVQMRV